MKLNIDCIRDILVFASETPYNQETRLVNIYEVLPAYSEDEIDYSIIKMEEAGLVKAPINHVIGQVAPLVGNISDITFSGHNFLANLESDTLYNKTKSVAKEIGVKSIDGFIQLSAAVLSELIKSKF